MRYSKASIVLGIAGFIGVASLAIAQTAPENDEERLAAKVSELEQGQKAIRKELEEIRRLLEESRRPVASQQTRDPAFEKVLDVGGRSARGREAARVALLEFTDYQCPFCRRHALQTQPLIESAYVETGKIRYFAFDLPLASHPLAFKAAETSRCAGDQGKFWQMRDRLFANQTALEPWNAHAEALGLDLAAFGACLKAGPHGSSVRRDMAEASKAGASGTPSFVVGLIDERDPSKVVGLRLIRGAKPYATFQQALDEALSKTQGRE